MNRDDEEQGPDGGVSEILAINRKVVEAFNRGGLEEAREYFHPDVELYDPDLPPGLELRGRDAMLKSIGEMVDAFDAMRVRSIEMYPVGERIVSLVRTEARGEGTRGEMQVEMHDAHVTTFRDGKVVYWRVYRDPREAFADVGLDPDAPGEPYRIDSV